MKFDKFIVDSAVVAARLNEGFFPPNLTVLTIFSGIS
jgi:hypothetical protein